MILVGYHVAGLDTLTSYDGRARILIVYQHARDIHIAVGIAFGLRNIQVILGHRCQFQTVLVSRSVTYMDCLASRRPFRVKVCSYAIPAEPTVSVPWCICAIRVTLLDCI